VRPLTAIPTYHNHLKALPSAIGSPEIPDALEALRDASLELLNARLLQQRVDRKYLLPTRLLEPLLARLCDDYQVVRSAGRLAATYDTLYLDTEDRRMYEEHRRRRGRRYKVRIRHHLDRQLSFLEIKRKDSDVRTTKSRLARPFGDSQLDAEACAHIERHSPFRAAALIPQLSIAFHRITLVGTSVNERITLDWDIEMRDDRRRELLGRIVVAEIKQARHSTSTPAARALRALHVREGSVSKYCLATVTLADVRSNAFKPALRAVEQLSA